jgi:hypothetical protein
LAFEARDSERRAISDSTTKFSNTNYIKSFHYILSELLNTDVVDIEINSGLEYIYADKALT